MLISAIVNVWPFLKGIISYVLESQTSGRTTSSFWGADFTGRVPTAATSTPLSDNCPPALAHKQQD